MSSHIAPRSTNEAAEFLKRAHKGPLAWKALCLKLQRQARGLPAVFPSAYSAMVGTPEKDRVYNVNNLRRGMVAYFDDPHDSNPYGHIVFISGINQKTGQRMAWTNDMVRRGGVDLVPISTFVTRWGDKFQFGATSLNGYKFPEFLPKDEKPEPKVPKVLAETYHHAIRDVERSLRFHKKQGDRPNMVKALERDLERMKRNAKLWPKP